MVTSFKSPTSLLPISIIFKKFYLTVEELKNEKLSSEETYSMLESRLVDLFNVKVFTEINSFDQTHKYTSVLRTHQNREFREILPYNFEKYFIG